MDIYPIVPADYTEQILLDITDVHGTNQIELYPNEITSVELFEGMYRLKCTGTGLFTQFFEIDHYSPSELTIEMAYELSVFSDDFSSLDNWEIESGSWQNVNSMHCNSVAMHCITAFMGNPRTNPLFLQLHGNQKPEVFSTSFKCPTHWSPESRLG